MRFTLVLLAGLLVQDEPRRTTLDYAFTFSETDGRSLRYSATGTELLCREISGPTVIVTSNFSEETRSVGGEPQVRGQVRIDTAIEWRDAEFKQGSSRFCREDWGDYVHLESNDGIVSATFTGPSGSSTQTLPRGATWDAILPQGGIYSAGTWTGLITLPKIRELKPGRSVKARILDCSEKFQFFEAPVTFLGTRYLKPHAPAEGRLEVRAYALEIRGRNLTLCASPDASRLIAVRVYSRGPGHSTWACTILREYADFTRLDLPVE